MECGQLLLLEADSDLPVIADGGLSCHRDAPDHIDRYFYENLPFVGRDLGYSLHHLSITTLCYPGPNTRERRSLYWIIPGITISFLAGAAFAFFVMVPAAIPFLKGFLADVVQPTWMVDEYIPFLVTLVFWVGVSFEAPLLCYFLARLGIIDAEMLLRGWRIALITIAILAAGITPTPDPFNMMLVMMPLIFLYFLGVFLAWLAGRRNRRKAKSAQR